MDPFADTNRLVEEHLRTHGVFYWEDLDVVPHQNLRDMVYQQVCRLRRRGWRISTLVRGYALDHIPPDDRQLDDHPRASHSET